MRPLLWLGVVLAPACSGLRLHVLDSATKKPSNVAVFFTVDHKDGTPVPGLEATQFRIYEDDAPVSVLESHQTILNTQIASEHYTLVLVDMSGSVTESGQLPLLEEAVGAFATRVEKFQKVAVYAFEGSSGITELTAFGSSGGRSLSRFRAKDPSTNLHGAVVAAVKELEQAMERRKTPLAFGSLIIFTDGSDRANRVSRDEMMRVLDAAPDLDVFVIGIGAEIDAGELSSIGRSGGIFNPDPLTIGRAFTQMAERVEAMSKRYYLLSYCTPARAGQRRLRIQATTVTGESGDLELAFDAKDFGPGCNAETPPPFDTGRVARQSATPSAGPGR